ncbi:MAG TPA: di-trans,poly-cis-decaprenylcistransferase [Bryobacteraceae bacterium]|jgi:undecaprenyl diphosphate synthase|nr:di-trans,poly-cis-decaprenylcistransferase [Bryobacteraceae bacterium]
MIQSTQFKSPRLHAAIIMDGNGRWALARGLPRLAGHHAGADAVRRTVEAAPNLGIRLLTLFAFSSDNWRRPPEEVSGLMQLLAEHLRSETARCLENGVRIQIIGRRDRLSGELPAAIAQAESVTAAGEKLDLRIAVDYSGRDAIAGALRHAAQAGLVCRECLEEQLGPPVDLLIRTGGEQRLSDFLLWECAYAELIFSRRMWPDFGATDLDAAVRQFHARQRRFGAIPPIVPAAVNGARAWLD